MSAPAPVRIAMWSGPRNISTAMMRSFENRPDTTVSDEPFYAAYLAATGLKHPMRAEILQSQPTNPDEVVAAITGTIPDGRTVWYQKHMTHHMLPTIDRSWIDRVTNAFLLRAPEAVVASYVKKRADVTLDDIGLPQQVELFERVADRLGHAPPVLDGEDVLADPKGALTWLCEVCGIAFDPAMLSWPAGPRPSDGVWAPAWYDQVLASTGFGPPRASAKIEQLDAQLRRVAEAARPLYEKLSRYRPGQASAARGGTA
jgi:hypothetical protein